MNPAHWIHRFLRNRENRPEPDWHAPVTLGPEDVRPLLRSLREFHLGDGGGDCRLIARDAARFRQSQGDMDRLVDLWFAEEAEHSRLLGRAVARFGGVPLRSHWSHDVFCSVRRAFGVRSELLVLLLTEIVSTAYYRLMRRHVPDPAVCDLCRLVLRDEAGHVAFHRDRMASAHRLRGSWPGSPWFAGFVFLGLAAGTMLWINHRRCLTRFGATTADFYREALLELLRFRRRLLREVGAREGSFPLGVAVSVTPDP
jgi:hypothetical protein